MKLIWSFFSCFSALKILFMFVGLQNWEAPSMCLSTQPWWNNKYRNSVFLGSSHMKALGNRVTFHKTGRPAFSLCSHSKARMLCAVSENLQNLRLWGASLLGWEAEGKRVFFHHPGGVCCLTGGLGRTQCSQKSFEVAWFISLKLISRSRVPRGMVRSPLFSTFKCCQLISMQTRDWISFSYDWQFCLWDFPHIFPIDLKWQVTCVWKWPKAFLCDFHKPKQEGSL